MWVLQRSTRLSIAAPAFEQIWYAGHFFATSRLFAGRMDSVGMGRDHTTWLLRLCQHTSQFFMLRSRLLNSFARQVHRCSLISALDIYGAYIVVPLHLRAQSRFALIATRLPGYSNVSSYFPVVDRCGMLSSSSSVHK